MSLIFEIKENFESKLYFVNGCGGTGKSFLYNTILAKTRSQNLKAIAVATTGIAGLLLDGGRTAHSRFRIQLEINETSSCNILVHDPLAKYLKEVKFIAFDEAVMANKYLFEAID